MSSDEIHSRPQISGIAEIVLNVRSIPVMRTFYTEILGFELFSQSRHAADSEADGEPTICFLTINPLDPPFGKKHPQLLALIDVRQHLAATKRFTGHEVTTSTLNHLAFQIPDDSYEAHLKRLNELGLEPLTTEFPNMDAKAVFFKDPEGNTLELICHAPK